MTASLATRCNVSDDGVCPQGGAHRERRIAQQSWLRGPAGLRSSHQSFMCLEGTPWHAPHIAITLCFSHTVPCPHTHCALSRAARGRRGETHRSRAGCPLSSAHVARSLLLTMPCSTRTRRSMQASSDMRAHHRERAQRSWRRKAQRSPDVIWRPCPVAPAVKRDGRAHVGALLTAGDGARAGTAGGASPTNHHLCSASRSADSDRAIWNDDRRLAQ